MSEVTNHLVAAAKAAGRKPLSLSAGALLTGALAVSLIFHDTTSRAASVQSPIDDQSVAALTALDRAMEQVTARVLRLTARHAIGDGQHRRVHDLVFSRSSTLNVICLSIAFAMS